MIHAEIITQARGWLDDPVAPFRWSLDDMIAYYNKTVNELCEKAKILVDSTTEAICKVNVLLEYSQICARAKGDRNPARAIGYRRPSCHQADPGLYG